MSQRLSFLCITFLSLGCATSQRAQLCVSNVTVPVEVEAPSAADANHVLALFGRFATTRPALLPAGSAAIVSVSEATIRPLAGTQAVLVVDVRSVDSAMPMGGRALCVQGAGGDRCTLAVGEDGAVRAWSELLGRFSGVGSCGGSASRTDAIRITVLRASARSFHYRVEWPLRVRGSPNSTAVKM